MNSNCGCIYEIMILQWNFVPEDNRKMPNHCWKIKMTDQIDMIYFKNVLMANCLFGAVQWTKNADLMQSILILDMWICLFHCQMVVGFVKMLFLM